MTQNQDNWSAKAYTSAASFVPKLTSTVLSYLDTQPTDRILDIGCGDGPLTAKIAALAPEGEVLGLDASASLIDTATSTHASSNCSFKLQDCTRLEESTAIDGTWDKVFSNAALHWILRKQSTRTGVFEQVHRALKPGGVFVFEMGGRGNVEGVHAAILATLVAHGVGIEKARETSPWFFPSDGWMKKALEDAGFEVQKVELEYRPTKCTPRSEDGNGGLEGWVRLMAAEFLAVVEEGKREAVVEGVCEIMETVATREEDGSQWLGYVRLRAVARKV